MSKFATKAADSPFYLARMEASKVNDRLASREGAADETGIDRSRMARVELGSANPTPEDGRDPGVHEERSDGSRGNAALDQKEPERRGLQ